MRSKNLGRVAKFGWRTPYPDEKRRTRNIEDQQWKVEADEEMAQEKEAAERWSLLAFIASRINR